MSVFFRKIYLRYQRRITVCVYSGVAIVFLAFISSMWLEFWQSLAMITMSIFFLFLPGLFTTLIFFPRHISFRAIVEDQELRRSLDPLERVTLAVLLSIVITSALVYILYIIRFGASSGSALTPLNFILFVIVINALLCIGAFLVHKYVMKKNKI